MCSIIFMLGRDAHANMNLEHNKISSNGMSSVRVPNATTLLRKSRQVNL